jgi:DNA-binding response OmpR family regulator
MVRSLARLSRFHRTRFWIADPRPADYRLLRSTAAADPVDFRFLATARDVLRRWPAALPDVFMANVQLPDMSGLDLVDMLRPFPLGVTVCIVDDDYAAEDEVRALSLGVHHYLCKPLEGAVLAAFTARCKGERTCRQ